ncbi:hypothetical protein [Pedobacter sp. GR22-6]|uniref:hypothetical protein n=1 Tax=Pedobacter sp. GR22-6 TaxID=3127957 RepID=UPI00307F1085
MSSSIKVLKLAIWNSPTIMTWMSYSTKALTLFGVLPLVLKQFSPGDIVLWYLFSTIISLQSIADFGFRQTFSRLISYAFGGATSIDTFSNTDGNSDLVPNYKLLNNIVSTMKSIYIWLTLILFILMSIFGTWSLIKPIKDASTSNGGWISWIVVLLVSCVGFYGKIYLNFLEGINKIALVRRIETFTSIGSILSSIGVLLFFPSLLNLVIVNQFWVMVVTLRDWYLCRHLDGNIYVDAASKLPFDRKIFNSIWQPAWRSGVSGFMSVGLTNLTGLIYAQVGNTVAVASYLLALRIINQIREVSMAPFYSKIPILAILRVKGDIKELVRVVKKGMFLSHIVFVFSFIIVAVFSNRILALIHSDVPFVSQTMWFALGIAFFMHRFGAMHIQVYLSTNHIISHIADGVSGILYIVSSLILIQYVGIYAIPIGMLIGYVGFYAWYAAVHSYRSLGINFLNFERTVGLPALLILILFSLLAMVINVQL